MKKNLLNALGTILIIYSLYLLFIYVPYVLTWFDSSKLFLISALLLIPIFLTVTAIGIFNRRNWAITAYWIAILLTFMTAYVYKATVIKNDIFLVLNAILAIALSTQWGKMKSQL